MNTIRLIACAAAFAGAASAQVVAVDSFSYTGALTANGWSAHSGAAAREINSDGSVATLDFQGGAGEDINLPFAPFADTATSYATFTLNVPSGNPVDPDGSGSYFAHLKDGSFGFRARTGLLSPAASGDFGLGINANNSNIGAGAVWASDLSFDTDYTLVISFDAATGTSQLWVDPTSSASTSVSHTGTSTGTVIGSFAWRQSNDHTGFINVDNLVVGGSYDDVTVADAANVFLPAASEVGCEGRVLHYTSAVSPPMASMPATWAAGTTAVLTVTNMDPAVNIGVLVFGTSTINATIFGGLLIPSADVVEILVGTAGEASLPIVIPAGLTGLSFWTQFAAFDSCVTPGSLAFSNGQQHLLP